MTPDTRILHDLRELETLATMAPVHDPRIYTVFKRSCTDWRSFARARKLTVATRLTRAEAQRMCDTFNETRTASQIRRGTKLEFTS